MAMKASKSPAARKTDDGTPKFRSKILGLSAVAEQNASPSPASNGDNDGADPMDAASLQAELARRQESYVRRERQYRSRIAELEAQLGEARAKKPREGAPALDASMARLRGLHRDILASVGQVQARTARILQEQEKDLLRAFRARLYSVQEELESEKHKTDDGASAWIERSKRLEAEVEWTKELADRLDRLNQGLARDNQRLKTQFSSQESDRDLLVRQLVAAKKDNASLRADMDTMRRRVDSATHDSRVTSATSSTTSSATSSMSASAGQLPKVASSASLSSHSPAAGGRPATAAGGTTATGGPSAGGPGEADSRYKDIVKRLKRLLEAERRNLQHARAALRSELHGRAELEQLLRECVADVRAELAAAAAGLGPQSGAADGAADERRRVVDALLRKERVLALLAAKAFPLRPEARGTEDEPTAPHWATQ